MTESPAPTGGAPRRRRLSEDERRRQIIAGCVEVLATEGYRRASLARVAQAAGVSKGLVSHYFEDHAALMEETAVATANLLRERASAAIDVTAPVPEVVRAAVRYASRLRDSHGDELRAISQVAGNLRREDGSPALDLSAYEETYRAIEALFARGQEEGTLRPFDTRVMAVTYQGALDTMIAYLDAHPDAAVDAYADTLADLLVAAIAA